MKSTDILEAIEVVLIALKGNDLKEVRLEDLNFDSDRNKSPIVNFSIVDAEPDEEQYLGVDYKCLNALIKLDYVVDPDRDLGGIEIKRYLDSMIITMTSALKQDQSLNQLLTEFTEQPQVTQVTYDNHFVGVTRHIFIKYEEPNS